MSHFTPRTAAKEDIPGIGWMCGLTPISPGVSMGGRCSLTQQQVHVAIQVSVCGVFADRAASEEGGSRGTSRFRIHGFT
jgi:hypothetical protein